jgi:hypothetical protein
MWSDLGMRTNTALRVGSVLLALVVGGAVGACSDSNSFAKACGAQARLNKAFGALPLGNGPDSPPGDPAAIKKAFPPVAKLIDEVDKELPEHPASVKKVLATLRRVGATGDASILDDFDSTEADAFLYDKCEGTDQERAVTAKEYEYDGGTQAINAGVVRIKLHNGGQQLHEMLILRSKDGSTPTKAEMEALATQGDEALGAKFDFIDAALAEQGKDAYLTPTLTKGSYVAVCMLPVGATSFQALQSGSVDGPPHLSQGMMRTFTVN